MPADDSLACCPESRTLLERLQAARRYTARWKALARDFKYRLSCAEANLTDLHHDYGILQRERDYLKNKRDQLRAEVERLRAALRRYGRHQPSTDSDGVEFSCPATSTGHPRFGACTCGLDAAR